MVRRPPRSPRTDTRFPFTTLCRSQHRQVDVPLHAGERVLDAALEPNHLAAQLTHLAAQLTHLATQLTHLATQLTHLATQLHSEVAHVVAGGDITPSDRREQIHHDGCLLRTHGLFEPLVELMTLRLTDRHGGTPPGHR